MDKAQAIQAFWASFGLTAFNELSALDEAMEHPDNYITYQPVTANFGDTDVLLSASVWYHSTSWAEISRKAEEISARIGYGGRVIKIDGGFIWFKLASPFSQAISAGQDDYRRLVLNVRADFLTAT